MKHIDAQKTEADALRHQLNTASELAMQANAAVSSKLEEVLREEKEQAAADRQTLLSRKSRAWSWRRARHKTPV